MKMVWIEGGEFMMGSDEDKENVWVKESPIHSVELDGFWIASTPVTQSQYKAIMVGKNPSHFKGDDLPVECVSWHDSNEFCKKLSGKTVREYSLPTEAQWEFAAAREAREVSVSGIRIRGWNTLPGLKRILKIKPIPLGKKGQMPGDFLICMAMCGNGARIGMGNMKRANV